MDTKFNSESVVESRDRVTPAKHGEETGAQKNADEPAPVLPGVRGPIAHLPLWKRPTTRRVVLSVVGWAATAASLAWVLKRVAVQNVFAVLGGASPTWLAVAVGASLAAEFGFAMQKHRLLLRAFGADLSTREMILVRAGTLFLRQFAPLKAGEVARLVWLKQRHGIPLLRSGTVAALDIASEFMVLAALLGLGLTWTTGGAGPLLALAGVVLALALVRPLTRHLPGRWRMFAAQLRRRDLRSTIWQVLLLASVVVVLDLLVFVAVLRAFGIAVPAADLMVCLPGVVLIAGASHTPMGLGVREAALVTCLAAWSRPEVLTAAALLVTVIAKVLPALLGLLAVQPLIANFHRGDKP